MFAQEIPTPSIPILGFSGSSTLLAQSASPLPESSSIPKQYVRWKFDPTISISQIPVTGHLLLTTENDPSRSAMNSFSLEFDVKAFQKMLRERVVARAKSIQEEYTAKASTVKDELSDPSVVSDLSRYNELKSLDSAGSLADSEKEELETLMEKTEDARNMAKMAQRYGELNPDQALKERQKELRDLKKEISDPSNLEDKLKEMNLLSGAEQFFFGLKDMAIGVSYPKYSPLVLSGLPVNGASLEYSLGLFTIAGAGGSTNGQIPDGRVATQTFDRKLFAGKLGVGTTESSHFHLSGLYVSDNESSANPDSAYTPAQNYVISADGQLQLFDRKLSIIAQAAGSMFTRDVTAPSIVIESSKDPTGLDVINELDPKISTIIDYAWVVGTSFSLFDAATKGKILVKMIGPGFTSLGVPYLRNDVLGQEGELQQELWSGQLKLGGYYKRNEDNILPWKRMLVNGEWIPARTLSTSYGATIDLLFKKLPYIRLEYAPYLQQTDIDTALSGLTNNTTLITCTAGHDYKIADHSASTTAMVLAQTGTSGNDAAGFTNSVYNVNQTLIFDFPLTITVGAGYSEIKVLNRLTTIANISSSASFQFSNSLQGSAGLSYNDRNDGGRRYGFNIRSKIKFWGNNELDVRVEKNMYENGMAIESSYNQLRIRASLTNKW